MLFVTVKLNISNSLGANSKRDYMGLPTLRKGNGGVHASMNSNQCFSMINSLVTSVRWE